MPNYLYKARDSSGKAVKGIMGAVTKEEVMEKLHKMGYMATYVAKTSYRIKIGSVFEKFKGINTEDMIVFNLQISNMINVGFSIMLTLETLDNEIENRKLKEVIGSVRRDIESGDSFSQALSKHPAIFSRLFINMVKAGESSGKLDSVLTRFAEFSEQQLELKRKIKGALFYPIILLFAGIGVTLFIVSFIIPQFAEIFIKSGIQLPVPTMILYRIGIWIKESWYIVILFMIIGGLGVRYYLKTQKGRLNFDRFKLKIPLIGRLFRKSAISRFSMTLGTLVSSGVPILESLDITKDVLENEVLESAIRDVTGSVGKGERIGDSLKISEEFPPDVVQMISVGEETGNLDGMLAKISDFYNRSLGYSIKKLTTLIEPLFLVVMGVMVGFIMLSMLLPIFDMVKVLRH